MCEFYNKYKIQHHFLHHYHLLNTKTHLIPIQEYFISYIIGTEFVPNFSIFHCLYIHERHTIYTLIHTYTYINICTYQVCEDNEKYKCRLLS